MNTIQRTAITRATRGSILVGAAVALVAGGVLVKGATAFWGEDAGAFFRGIIRNPKRVGAFTPCSVFVSKEITKWVTRDVRVRNGACVSAQSSAAQGDMILGASTMCAKESVLRVLEAGGGSGVFTSKLVEQLERLHGLAYVLDVIEIDPGYCKALTKRFASYPNVHIHCVDMTLWEPAYAYDYIVSSLPFTNIPTPVVDAILAKYQRLIKPGGIVSYVELMLAHTRRALLHGNEKQEFDKKVALLEQFNDSFEIQKSSVWLNITPAYVHHLQIAA